MQILRRYDLSNLQKPSISTFEADSRRTFESSLVPECRRLDSRFRAIFVHHAKRERCELHPQKRCRQTSMATTELRVRGYHRDALIDLGMGIERDLPENRKSYSRFSGRETESVPIDSRRFESSHLRLLRSNEAASGGRQLCGKMLLQTGTNIFMAQGLAGFYLSKASLDFCNKPGIVGDELFDSLQDESSAFSTSRRSDVSEFLFDFERKRNLHGRRIGVCVSKVKRNCSGDLTRLPLTACRSGGSRQFRRT